MSTLVAYATRHGSTQGIAERIAERLRAAGLDAEARPVKAVRDPAAYDAFVVGGAAYMFHWMKEASSFTRRYRDVLSSRPLWLFSSGPLGTETTDQEGRDVLETSEPREFPEIRAMLHPRDVRVFFGAFDAQRKAIGFSERFVMMMPAARAAFPQGDFRDWPRIEAWADGIASELKTAAAAGR